MIEDDNLTRLWLIDAGYLFNAQETYEKNFRFDYLKLRRKLEEYGEIWRVYYFNSVRKVEDASQDGFHNWLQSALPDGPKFITKIYRLRSVRADSAYCRDCGNTVRLTCPHTISGDPVHTLGREQQKGVDAGIVTAALRFREEYDVLMLSSGDGDLVEAMEYLTEQHSKILQLAVFRTGVSTGLQSRADSIFFLDDFADEIRRSP